MKRGDDVFLLTLVDLLLQFLFLGLVVYAVASASRANAEERNRHLDAAVLRLDSIAAAQGFANVRELTDSLTRLAPVRELLQLASLARDVGGVDSMATVVERIRRGSGAPPCIFSIEGGREAPRSIATITAWDDSLSISPIAPDTISALLRSAGAPSIPAGKIPLGDFRRRFSPIRRRECRYQVILIERTEYARARDTINTVFAFTRRSR